MMGGIDQEVSSRVDKFRSNPQALMQQYQQSQQLLDLLALQKLKTEKEAAAREMQLQMQQMPGTIAQQREQEVLGLTKNEMVGNTAGGLGQLANQMQQQQGQPQQQPAPQGQPQQFRGGGIVAFAGGGDAEISDRALDRMGISREQFNRLPPETQKQVIAQLPPERSRVSEVIEQSPLLSPAVMAAKAPGVIADTWRTAGEYGPNLEELMGAITAGVTGGDSPPIPGMLERRPPREPPVPGEPEVAAAPPPAPDQAPAQPPAGIESLGGGASVSASGYTPRNPQLLEAADKQAMESMQRDPTTEAAGIAKLFRDQMALPEGLEAEREAARADQKRINREQQDPDKLRREKVLAWMQGFGGGHNFGAGAQGGAANMRNTRRQQEISQKSRADEERADVESLITEASGINRGAVDAANTERGNVQQAIEKAMQYASESERNAILAQSNILQRQQMEMDKMLRQYNMSNEQIAKTIKGVEERLMMMPDYMKAQEIYRSKNPSPDEILEAQRLEATARFELMKPFAEPMTGYQAARDAAGAAIGLPAIPRSTEDSGEFSVRRGQ